MSEQPPPPQVSPDGRFYWDGQRWVPMPAQAQQPAPPLATAVPAPPFGYEIKKTGHGWRNAALGCVGIVALLFLIPFCVGLAGLSTTRSSSLGGSSPAASPLAVAVAPSASTTHVVSSPTAKASTAPSAPPAPTVRLDKTGSGTSKTAIFQTPGEWTITYYFDCTGFGFNGNFQIYVYDGASVLKDLPVNALALKGSDTVYEHNLSGPYYLEINSECDWHVVVAG
jgi:hypothetical protein